MLFSGVSWLALVSIVASSTLPPLGYERRLLKEVFDKRSNNASEPSCIAEGAPTTVAPRPNVWLGLTAEENFAVWSLLHDPASGLNLTHPDDAVLTDNYV
jgi:primary-amine oxidase